jgi:prephenate dehydrogenase
VMITSLLISDGKSNTYLAEPTCCFISYENHDHNTTEYSHIPSLAFHTLARSTDDNIGDRRYEKMKRTYKVLLKRFRTSLPRLFADSHTVYVISVTLLVHSCTRITQYYSY